MPSCKGGHARDIHACRYAAAEWCPAPAAPFVHLAGCYHASCRRPPASPTPLVRGRSSMRHTNSQLNNGPRKQHTALTVSGAVRLLHPALVDDLHVVADAGVLVHYAAPQEAVFSCRARGQQAQLEWEALAKRQPAATRRMPASSLDWGALCTKWRDSPTPYTRCPFSMASARWLSLSQAPLPSSSELSMRVPRPTYLPRGRGRTEGSGSQYGNALGRTAAGDLKAAASRHGNATRQAAAAVRQGCHAPRAAPSPALLQHSLQPGAGRDMVSL